MSRQQGKMQMHIGVLEDDPDQRTLMDLWLRSAGHSVQMFGTVSEMLGALKGASFDALLLDWMLPDGNGGEVLRWVRQSLEWKLAIVVLTSRADEQTVVEALQAGADDFVVKPAKQQELNLRLQSAARRASPAGLPVMRMGAYEIDVPKHSLLLNGTAVTLTQKEFDLSVYLFQNPVKLMSRDHLLDRIWGISSEVDSRTVDTHVSRIRKKLKLDGKMGWKMVPVYGYGYRLERVDL
jgi:two-component system, OmpR family, response regulator RegX3